MNIIKTAFVAALLGLASYSYADAQNNYSIDYKKLPENKFGAYEYLPSIAVKLDYSNSGVNALIQDVFNNDIRLDTTFLWAYESARVNANGDLIIYKQNAIGFNTRQYYRKPFTTDFIHCFNGVKPKNDKEIDDYFRAIEFVKFPKDVEKLNNTELDKLIGQLKWVNDSIKSVFIANGNTCPAVVNEMGLEIDADFKNVEKIIEALLLDTENYDGYLKWNRATRASFYDFWANADGYWHGKTKLEVPRINRDMIQLASYPSEFITSLKAKNYRDFLEFMAEFRSYSNAQGKSSQVGKTLGTACLASVEQVFEPFSLASCIDQNRLQIVPSDIEGHVMIVKGPTQ